MVTIDENLINLLELTIQDKNQNNPPKDNEDNEEFVVDQDTDKDDNAQNDKDDFTISDEENPDDTENNDQEQNANDDTTDQNTDNENDNNEDEFTIGDEDTEDNQEETPDDTNIEEPTDDSEGINKDIANIEAEIFNNLTEPQKVIMNTKLKGTFGDLYFEVDNIFNKLSQLKNIDAEVSKIISKIMDTLTDLDNYIEDYLDKTYDTKSYTENLTVYQKCLVILNSVKKVLNRIQVKLDLNINNE